MAATANFPPEFSAQSVDPYAALARSIFVDDWRASPHISPRIVYYVAGRVTYVRPDQYFFGRPVGPSDSVWIVPGTLR